MIFAIDATAAAAVIAVAVCDFFDPVAFGSISKVLFLAKQPISSACKRQSGSNAKRQSC